jgi:large subunit ribosomal protein L15
MAIFKFTKHPSNTKRKRRCGRGIAAGRGKTSGRGQTGQKSRSGGNIHPRMEGGRMPTARQFGKIGGFKRRAKIHYYPVNLGDLNHLPDGTDVDLAKLFELGLLPSKLRRLKVKLLGDGEFERKMNFRLHAFSHIAKAKVEALGGTCEVVE